MSEEQPVLARKTPPKNMKIIMIITTKAETQNPLAAKC